MVPPRVEWTIPGWKVHSDLFLTGVFYDREAELSQLVAIIDDRRHLTNCVVVLDFQDRTHLDIPVANLLQTVLPHLMS